QPSGGADRVVARERDFRVAHAVADEQQDVARGPADDRLTNGIRAIGIIGVRRRYEPVCDRQGGNKTSYGQDRGHMSHECVLRTGAVVRRPCNSRGTAHGFTNASSTGRPTQTAGGLAPSANRMVGAVSMVLTGTAIW